MPVPAYTDLFNVALDNLTTTLNTITGLTVTNDPRNINPPCAFIDAPSLAVTGGRPTVAVYGGAEYAAYDLTIDLKASTTA